MNAAHSSRGAFFRLSRFLLATTTALHPMRMLGIACLATASHAGAAQDALRIIGDTDPMQVYVSVNASDGTPVGGLMAGAFQLSEDGSAQVITSAVSTTDQPVTTVFVMDYSPSMRNTGSVPPMENAVKGFIDLMESGDEAAVIKFNNTVVVSQNLTTDTTLLKNAVDASPGDAGNTKLYDAIDKAIEIIGQSGNTAGIRSIVVLSDGDDVGSTLTLAELAAHLDAADVPVFTIGYGPSIATNVMQGLANGTGGLYYSASNDSGQFANIYTEISERLNNEYHLTYFSGISDCNVHTLQVQVATPEGTKTYNGSFRRCFSTDPLLQPAPRPARKKGGGGGSGPWEPAALLLAALFLVIKRRTRHR